MVSVVLLCALLAYLVLGWRADNRAEALRRLRHEELLKAIHGVRHG